MDPKTFLKRVFTGRTPWTYLYLFLIPFVNWGFDKIHTIPLPTGGDWHPLTVVTGLTLVVRDFAQREVGHYIFAFLGIGLVLSFMTSDPSVAFASTCAFAISELIDWALFTFAKIPLSKRVFLSSGISAPIDAAVFLAIASQSIPGIFNPWSFAAAIISRFIGCWIVYFLMRNRDKREAAARAAQG
jgi:uncharacterized PurR-regulated membrane protein YhhQ (DUF165 family)